MHLITQPVHVFPCSNSPMKGKDGTNRTPRYCCPNHHKTSPVFHCWNQAFRIVGFLVCSPNVNSSWCRKQREGRLIWPYHARVSSCLMSRFHGRDTSFTHLSITSNNQRFINCSPTVNDGFVKLTESFCENRTFRMNIQFCCSVTCAAVVLWFFETILNVRRSLSINVEFRPLFLFTDVVFPCLHNLRNCRSRYT
jgi:phosphatidylinositol kinase/protein kinase (PI-3  family)